MTNDLLAALEVIETIVGGDRCELWDMENSHRKFRGKAKEMHELLNAVYRIAHSANPNHSCYHVHEKWRQEIAAIAEASI
jgi:hypothetical protein